MGPKIGILALQGATEPHRAVLDALGATVVDIRAPEDLVAVDAVVLPGGESTTMSFLLDLSSLRQPLSERLGEGMPAFGTCAGMILLATDVLDGRPDQQSLGAIDITVRRNAFGRQRESFELDLDIAELGEETFHAVFIRAPAVESIGDGVEVLASVGDRPVLCRQGAVTVSAFHPEFSGDFRLHQRFLQEIT